MKSRPFKIFFKNVGQGDCIVLHWTGSNGEEEIGIIDCNLVDGGINPIIDHLLTYRIIKIKFIIMSHPHTDHFSGLRMLLEHCELNNIAVSEIYHTAGFTKEYLNSIDGIDINEFINYIVPNPMDKKEICKLLNYISKLHKAEITHAKILGDNSVIQLSRDISIEFLAPGAYNEGANYLAKLFRKNKSNRPLRFRNNPNANILSTVAIIKSSNWTLLLTSDATSKTINRINKYLLKNLDLKIKMVQIPHHGSVNGHCEDLVKNISLNGEVCAIASVGEDYGHPNKKTLISYYNYIKEVHFTNCTSSIKEYLNENVSKHSPFDLVSRVVSEDSLKENALFGEKLFIIEPDGEWEIITNPNMSESNLNWDLMF